MVLSVILARVVAAPIASGKSSSQSQNLGKLTGDWWNWAVSTSPSPLEGSYKGGTQCDGNFVDGVFFLGGSTTSKAVKRTCTVPANTPILFPVVNAVCSAAPAVQQPNGTFTGDPKPYTKCSQDRSSTRRSLVPSGTRHWSRLSRRSRRLRTLPHLVCKRPQRHDAGRALHVELHRTYRHEARDRHHHERSDDEPGQPPAQNSAVSDPLGKREDPDRKGGCARHQDGEEPRGQGSLNRLHVTAGLGGGQRRKLHARQHREQRAAHDDERERQDAPAVLTRPPQVAPDGEEGEHQQPGRHPDR